MEPTERVTVMLPSEMLASIDRHEGNRDRFVVEAVARELERRRREALACSQRAPHPDAAELADVGLAEWAARLPAGDEDVVDPTAGTPLRWVEGRGWVEDPR
jgi:hypothetical protein